jgi:hypothetical protein
MTMQHANDAKASFDSIYTKRDPRDYYSVLGSLDYSIPDLAKPVFRQIAAAWRLQTGHSATILDLGSSYGINAALFRYPLTFDMLRRRYARREMLTLSSEKLHELDRNYFSSWPRTQAEKIIVADVSEPAVSYAVASGIADEAIAFDFERDTPPSSVLAKLADVDIIMSTGCVGYVSEKTFEAILAATGRVPWVVSFCLRMFSYDDVAGALGRVGLETEKLQSAAFVQRRFRDEEEAAGVLGLLAKRGIDPNGFESDGLLFAELFVSRPPEHIAAAPLDQMVTIASGRNINFGPRLVEVRRGGQLAPVRL